MLARCIAVKRVAARPASPEKRPTTLLDAETAGTEARRKGGRRSCRAAGLAVASVDTDVWAGLICRNERGLRPDVPRHGALTRVGGGSRAGDLELFTPARRV